MLKRTQWLELDIMPLLLSQTVVKCGFFFLFRTWWWDSMKRVWQVVRPPVSSWLNRAPPHHQMRPAVIFRPTRAHACRYAPSVSQLRRPSSSHLLLLSLLSPPLSSFRPDSRANPPHHLSTPRYNVSCHPGPLYLRQNPAADRPLARKEVLSASELRMNL